MLAQRLQKNLEGPFNQQFHPVTTLQQARQALCSWVDDTMSPTNKTYHGNSHLVRGLHFKLNKTCGASRALRS